MSRILIIEDDEDLWEGSGIGLYLSKMILEKEKGYITVSSKLGEGSCFTVFLQNCKGLKG